MELKHLWNTHQPIKHGDFQKQMTGWWLTYPSEKYEWKSVGMMKFPTEWKINNVPNQPNKINGLNIREYRQKIWLYGLIWYYYKLVTPFIR